MTIWQILITFLALFITDIFWAFYLDAVKDGIPLKSASWAVAMFAVGAVGVINYVNHPMLLIPALAGSFCGTYLGVWRNNRKNK